MRMFLRMAFDKCFTSVAFLAVLSLTAILVVVLGPMLGRGLAAVVFRETIEFRKMEFYEFGRGDEDWIQNWTARNNELREPVYAMLDEFAEGIDVERQIDRAKDLYRDYGDNLRLADVPQEKYSDLRGQARDLRNLLVDAFEATDKEQAREYLAQVLAGENEPVWKGTLITQYFDMARRYGRTLDTIDLSRRETYAADLEEVQQAIRSLLGPRPGDPVPALAEMRYGATRWDLAEKFHMQLQFDETWVAVEPGAPLEKKLIPRQEIFAGTSLEPLFPFVREHLNEMLKPSWRFYWRYFTDSSTPGHFYGGLGPEILGTLLLTLVAMCFSVPLGIVSAAYLVEVGGDRLVLRIIRTCINTLAGVPSIVFGLFGLAFFVLFVMRGEASVLTAGLTLGLLVLPVVIRASEEAIRSVPHTYKEASLALGAGRFRTFVAVTLPAALPGVLTGVILSLSRAAGETAPILFTGAAFLAPIPNSLFDKTPALSYTVLGIATGDRTGMRMPHQQWGTVMTLILLVLCLNTVAIIMRSRISKKLRGY